MAELEHIEVTRIERDRYRWYHIAAVTQDWRSPIGMHLSPDELLALAAYVEQNRAQLEQEAHEDGERNARAWDEDEGTWDSTGLHQCPYCYDLVNEEHEEFCRLNPNRNREIVP